MKKLITLFALMLCLFLSGKIHAQHALPGMRSLAFHAGMVDGYYTDLNRNDIGYYFGMSMATYARNANRWVFGVEYLNRNYPYKEGHIPVAQFTGEGGYYYTFLSDPSKTLFLSIGASALAGYETVNWDKKLLDDGTTLRNKDAFIYGGALTLEIEIYLSDRFVFFLSASERVLWGTTTGHFRTQLGGGVKIIIN